MKTYQDWLVDRLMFNTDYTKEYLYSRSTNRMFYYTNGYEVELFHPYEYYDIYLKELEAKC